METVQELDMVMRWYGETGRLNIDIHGYELTLALRTLAPHATLEDESTLLKLVSRAGEIKLSFEPEDGIADSENVLRVIREKCKPKKTIGSILKIVFAEIGGGEVVPECLRSPSNTPEKMWTPEYLRQTVKKSTPGSDSYDGSTTTSGSGIPIYYSRLCEDYLKHEQLGEGGSGDVDRYTHILSGMEQAIKIVSLENTNDKNPLDEVKTLCCVQHENVVKFYDAWINKETYRPDPQLPETKVYKTLAIAMEYCPSTLAKELERGREFSTKELETIFLGIAKSLSFIHDKGVVHGDLSPDNIFIGKDGVIKIGDFGSAITLPLGETTFKLEIGKGKPAFRAPEVKLKDSVVNSKIDIFSFGIIMYYLMNSRMDLKKKQDAIRGARAGKTPKDLSSSYLGRQVALLLHMDPDARPSAFEVVNLFAMDG